MEDIILRTEHVSKSYAKKKALDDVSIEVRKGSVFGLLGPNGAGKTTLIRMITQITMPDEGRIFFGGEPLSEKHIRSVGYLPEERGLYKRMKVGEQALYLAQLRGMSTHEAKKSLDYWFSKFGISDWYDKKLQELSKGMQQKVQFITTVMHSPSLLIFDEPFSGFDPLNVSLLKNEILSLRDKGATIIFSTHNMESVEELCDEIALINKSHLILSGKVSEIRQQFRKNEYEIVTDKDNIAECLTEGVAVKTSERLSDGTFSTEVIIADGSHAEFLSSVLKTMNILSYRELLPSMNEIFINTVKQNDHE